MEVHTIIQVADGKRAQEASHVRRQQPIFLTGGVSAEDRSQRAETVSPQHDEHNECQFVWGSALSAKNDVNEIELNGVTDNEIMEDGETGVDDGSVQVRNIRDPGQPTESEHREHMATHRLYRSRCKFCVMGRGVNSLHWRSDAQDDVAGVLHLSMDWIPW